MTVLRSVLLFDVAALAEIAEPGWSGKASANIAAWPLSVSASSPQACMASWPPCNPTHISGASWPPMGGVFVAGSLAWGMLVDGFRPDRCDLVGAGLGPAGVAMIIYTPRPS
jgi:small multidrug resistance family-3 protein